MTTTLICFSHAAQRDGVWILFRFDTTLWYPVWY
jgi:hypothetical protein